jgi:hypothetical protein
MDKNRIEAALSLAAEVASNNGPMRVALSNYRREFPSNCFGAVVNEARQMELLKPIWNHLCFAAAADVKPVEPAPVPRHSAMTFKAAVAMQLPDTGGALDAKDIKLVARTGGIAHHGHYGRCIHDMSGFIKPTKPVVLDFNHDGGEPVGYATNFSTAGGNLTATGKLLPFEGNDAASKIIFQGKAGVPYQCSIVMNPDVQTEEVKAGQSVKVNNGTFTGPGTIFRKWSIDGVALLPYGSDSATSVEFSRSSKN